MKRDTGRAGELAAEILKLARSELLVPLRFLDTALFRLKDTPGQTKSYAVDGEHLFYDVSHVLHSCREESETVARDILHMVFHCLFSHPFRGGEVDSLCYDLAVDMAVENVINELELPNLACKRQHRQDFALERLKKHLRFLTAEKIYRVLVEGLFSQEEMISLREDFAADDHEFWYVPLAADGDNVGKDFSLKKDGCIRRRLSHNGAAAVFWGAAQAAARVDMDTFSKEWGSKAGGLAEALDLARKSKNDYRSFLKRFAVLGETLKTNEEEFDYIFYTYGLELYGNLPFIEPLEYREERKIRDFVIAIDTSASVSGRPVRRFLEQTYAILCEENHFFEEICIHIIQCDTEIQEDAVIRSREEFDAYLDGMELKGFGGTDFRPVFAYVNELLSKGHFQSLKGLLYFTDGYGDYPRMKPEYETAFIFLERERIFYDVPPWAMKVVLDGDEVWML